MEALAVTKALDTKLPDCEAIISSGRVSLDQLLAIYWRSIDPEEKNRSAYLQYYPKIREMYENENGKIVNFWSDFHAQLATVYTIKEKVVVEVEERWLFSAFGKHRLINKEEIHVRWGKGVQPDTSALEIIEQGDVIEIEARRLLEGTEAFHMCMYRLYRNVTYLFSFLAENPTIEQRNRGNSYSKLIDFLKNRLAEVKDYYIRSAKRRAQINYLGGMIKGLGIDFLVSYFFGWAIVYLLLNASPSPNSIPIEPSTLVPIFWSLIAGAFGAMISVMLRMSTEEGLKLDVEADPKQINYVGAFRPIIGSTMGVVIYVLMMSGLLPIQLPEESKMIYFIIIIAFISGFAERFAKDMLGVAQKSVAGQGEQEEPEEQEEQPPSPKKEPPSPEKQPKKKPPSPEEATTQPPP